VLDYKKANVMKCGALFWFAVKKVIQLHPLLICRIVANLTLHHGANSPSAW